MPKDIVGLRIFVGVLAFISSSLSAALAFTDFEREGFSIEVQGVTEAVSVSVGGTPVGGTPVGGARPTPATRFKVDRDTTEVAIQIGELQFKLGHPEGPSLDRLNVEIRTPDEGKTGSGP